MTIKDEEKIIKEQNDDFTIYDYKLGSILTGINLFEIHGRMPQKNYMISRKNDRAFYVLSGTGLSYVDGISRSIEKGDVVYITTSAKFSFEGNIKLLGLKK